MRFKADFDIGIRGGDIYLFPNTERARVILSSMRIPRNPKTISGAIAYINAQNMTYRLEYDT